MKKVLFIIFCIVHSNINAQSWQDCSLTISNNLNGVQFIDNKHGWIVGDSGLILKYDNGNWISIESELSTYNLNKLYFTDSIHGWIIGSDGLILKYNNDTISNVNSPVITYLNDIYMIDSSKGWIVGYNKTIVKYSENTWSKYPTDHFPSGHDTFMNIQFLDSTFGIITGGNETQETLVKYEDGEWIPGGIGGDDFLKGLYIKDKENIYTSNNEFGWHGEQGTGSFINYNSLTGSWDDIGNIGWRAWDCEIAFGETMGWAISYTQLFKYEDEHFVKFENNTTITNSLNSICIVNDSTAWIVGDSGTILKYHPHVTNILEIEKNVIEIYPNPFQDYLIINSDLPINYIEVFNTIGAKIESIQVYNETSIEYNFSNLQTGIYFLKIKTENSEFIQKVIKK